MYDINILVNKLYGKNVNKVTKLAGEIDLNYKIETEDKSEYILKIAHEEHDQEHLEMENAAMLHLSEEHSFPFQLPVPVVNKYGHYIANEDGKNVRLIKWLDGELWSNTNPHSPKLLRNLGQSLGKLHQGLENFDHTKLHRKFLWDPAQFDWIKKEADELFVEEGRHKLIHQIIDIWDAQKDVKGLPRSCCYLDANDHNVIVSPQSSSSILGFIDFGDITYTYRVNELAVCLAYVCMGKNDPIEAAIPVIRGFNDIVPLQDAEIAFLHSAVLARLAISVSFAAKRKSGTVENPYLAISEKPAWALIQKLLKVHPRYAEVCYRGACGLEPAPNSPKVIDWIKENNKTMFPIWGHEVKTHPVTVFDWSVGSTALGNVDQFHDLEFSTYKVFRQMKEEGSDIGIGRYNEPRPVYSTMEYARRANNGPEWRTVHLGIDVFLPVGAPSLCSIGWRSDHLF